MTDSTGVTVDDLRDYLASDAPDEFLQRLIDEAEYDAHHIVVMIFRLSVAGRIVILTKRLEF